MGKLEKQENNCTYFITPDSTGKAIVTIFSRKKPNKKLGQTQFRVKHIPEPVAMISGKSGGEISKKILEVQIGITSTILNMDIDARVVVTGFNMTVYRNNQILFNQYCDSARFNDKMKRMFNDLNPADRILFSNISYKGPGKTGNLQPIEFIIADSKE